LAITFDQTVGRITISAQKIENDLLVKITDSGIGMPKERIEKLFTLSDNYSTPGTQNEIGTGLGLILCKEFVEKNNGKIWIESIVDNGSSFCFSLPTTNNQCSSTYTD
jgi:signal transduction histidine kinase